MISFESFAENQFLFEKNGVSLTIKREDLIDPYFSGNKIRKLKYNFLKIKELKCKNVLTFGGAYSNHLLAVALLSKQYKLKSYGVVRGDELQLKERNATLKRCESLGMELVFVSRSDYQKKEQSSTVIKLFHQLKSVYLLPEGGSNSLGIKGCEEIIQPSDRKYDVICCPVGTGGTLSGIINSSEPHQQVLGFMASKDAKVHTYIESHTQNKNWKLIHDYTFGGYGKTNSELLNFVNKFSIKYKILLDPIYTGKMLFGIFAMIENRDFPKNILAIHTGGIQGIKGFNEKQKKKNQLQLFDEL